MVMSLKMPLFSNGRNHHDAHHVHHHLWHECLHAPGVLHQGYGCVPVGQIPLCVSVSHWVCSCELPHHSGRMETIQEDKKGTALLWLSDPFWNVKKIILIYNPLLTALSALVLSTYALARCKFARWWHFNIEIYSMCCVLAGFLSILIHVCQFCVCVSGIFLRVLLSTSSITWKKRLIYKPHSLSAWWWW